MKKPIILFLMLFLLIQIGFSQGSNKKKFQLEVIGGFSALSPKDLNSNPDLHNQIINFWYEDRYAYYAKVGYIQSFETDQEGKCHPIKSALPFGLRLKYYVIHSLAISLGFKYLARYENSYFRHQLTYLENDGIQRIFLREYSPFTTATEAFIPTLGIHFEKGISEKIGLEIFMLAGPLFGRCEYSYDSQTEKKDNGNLTETSSYSLEEIGRGTGIALDGGVRMNYSMSKILGLFIEVGYAFQNVNDLQGPGHSNSNGEREEWEGEWGMKDYYSSEYWGFIDSIHASNSWEYPEDYLWIRKFKLDLSGFQTRIGFSFRF